MLDQFNAGTDEAKRQLYVAMTRAKRNLAIHYNGNYLNAIKTEGLNIIDDPNVYPPPSQLTMQLTFKDVWLDFFISRQNLISQLTSGDVLAFDGECCRNSKGDPVLKVSKQLIKQLQPIIQKNYIPQYAIVRYILYWRKEDSENEIKIILPEIYFEKAAEAVKSSIQR